MHLGRLWLTDFRNYAEADVPLAPGLTAVVGGNGEGKSNLLEAVGFLASLSSFRGAPVEALVRVGAERAVVRAEAERADRRLLIEAELAGRGTGADGRGVRTRVQVNRQRLGRARDLLGALRVTVFSPDDLTLVKGGPAERRRFLDDTLVALAARYDAVRADVERVLRQRNALLRQAGGRLSDGVAATLDVWDAKLVEHGEALARGRTGLVARLEPELGKAYDQVASTSADVQVAYDAPWMAEGLAPALASARTEEVRRGVSLVGPHRDELVVRLGGLPARTHASQGEQRSLALALRLAAHAVVTDAVGTPPVLLLDDVFSELDPDRSAALLAHLPAGQAVLTTAGPLPADAHPELVLRVAGGRVAAA